MDWGLSEWMEFGEWEKKNGHCREGGQHRQRHRCRTIDEFNESLPCLLVNREVSADKGGVHLAIKGLWARQWHSDLAQ